MEVSWHPGAEAERFALPPRELAAVQHAVAKLIAEGSQLRFPHSSSVQGATNLRELRPRGGRSRWRVFYRRVGDVFVLAAIGPEAQVNSAGFSAAVTRAVQRLAVLEQQGGGDD